MNEELERLRKENLKLKIDLQIKEVKLAEIQKDLNRVFIEKEVSAAKKEGEEILYKLAHAINNDLHSSSNLLRKLDSNSDIQKVIRHLERVQSLVDLNIWWVKRDELEEKWTKINIETKLKELISSVKDGVSTLRVSPNLENKIVELNVDINKTGTNTDVITGKEKFPEMIELIFLDLIRNAFKYMDEDNPWVKVDIDCENNDFITVTFANSGKMAAKYLEYLNTEKGSSEISDSTKIGLRSIKQWINFLKLELVGKNYEDEQVCRINLKIPRIIYL